MQPCAVAPFAGVWIEIQRFPIRKQLDFQVAPFAGVWIEIKVLLNGIYGIPSHPSRVCGLKYKSQGQTLDGIEGRTLRGCVD